MKYIVYYFKNINTI